MEYRYFYGHSVISSSLTGLTVTYMHEKHPGASTLFSALQ